MYLVVFQMKEQADSLAGAVFVVEYESEEDFIAQSNKLSAEISSIRAVIAKGVSREEADSLIQLSKIPKYSRCQNCADCLCKC